MINESIFDRASKAAEGSKNERSFLLDMERCKNAIDMCGLPQIKAESWGNVLEKMTPFDIYQYVENRYHAGMLNPFDQNT